STRLSLLTLHPKPGCVSHTSLRCPSRSPTRVGTLAVPMNTQPRPRVQRKSTRPTRACGQLSAHLFPTSVHGATHTPPRAGPCCCIRPNQVHWQVWRTSSFRSALGVHLNQRTSIRSNGPP